MKMTWAFLVVAAVLAVSVSSASIKNAGPNTPEERDWMDKLKEGLEDFMNHVDDMIKNLKDRISRGNKKAKECFKKFKKEFESAVNQDALKHEDYATYVRGIIKDSDNALNISDFAQRVNAMKNFFEGASEDLNELIKQMEPIVAERIKCTHNAFQEAFGNGETTAASDDGSSEEATTDSGSDTDNAADDHTEDTTGSDAENATDDDVETATDSDAETATDDGDNETATDDGDAETATDDGDNETATGGDVETATDDGDNETATGGDVETATNDDNETATGGDVETATQVDA